jgi:hypothetical protein
MEFSYPPAQALTIYVGLLDEGVTVWRPVVAREVSPGLYELTGAIAEGERWEYQPGQVVECECRALDGGDSGLVAT